MWPASVAITFYRHLVATLERVGRWRILTLVDLIAT